MEIYFYENEDELKIIYSKEEIYNTLISDLNESNDTKILFFKQKYSQIQMMNQNEIIKEFYKERYFLLQILNVFTNLGKFKIIKYKF